VLGSCVIGINHTHVRILVLLTIVNMLQNVIITIIISNIRIIIFFLGRTYYLVRFQVLVVTSMKIAVVWDVAPCSLVDTDWHFRGVIITLIMEAVSSSETSLSIYQTTWCNTPEDSHLQLIIWLQMLSTLNLSDIMLKFCNIVMFVIVQF
jgi:hypothetical protein